MPDAALLIENRSTNTGDNVVFTRSLLAECQIEVRSVLAVQKPYMERRTFATLRRQWPEVDVRVTSPQLDFDDYCSTGYDKNTVIDIMVGDLQRILEYPKHGFMIPQVVPDDVMDAFHHLVSAGHTSHMLNVP